MSNDALQFDFGKSQLLTSERMNRNPTLSRIVYKIFGYTNVGNWARSLVVTDLFRKLPLTNFKNIMDLGAGLGEFSFMLSEALPHAKITALEILPDRLEILNKTKTAGNFKNIEIYPDKIESLSGKEIYDFIFAVDVFEHIYKEEMPFKACYEKLKPGGFLMVKIPNITQRTILPDSWFEEHNHWLDDEHVGQVYDLNGLKERFESEGFTIVHSSASDGLFSRLGWEIGYLAKRKGTVVQLMFLPLCKLLIQMDRLLSKSVEKGNAIQVIGKK